MTDQTTQPPRAATPPKLVEIAAGAEQKRCGCGVLMYMAPYPTTGNRHPFCIANPDGSAIEGAFAPTETTPGRGISHFKNCPNANTHGRRR